MKAKDLLALLWHELDPEMEVHCIEETDAAVTVNMRGDDEKVTCFGPEVRIIVKPPADEEEESEPVQVHELRARSLAMLRSHIDPLRRMADTEAILADDVPAALMAANYALMELSLETAQRAGEIPDPIQVLRNLFEAGSLEDHFYAIRESEGQGWEGPRMVKWGKACEAARKLMGKSTP